MNALELQTIRHILTMTVEGNARYTTHGNNTTAWQQWGKGERGIPGDIICICSEMKARRELGISVIIDKINNRIDNSTMRFFPDLNAFQAVYHHDGFLDWEIYQSAAVELRAHDLERMCQEITTPCLFSPFTE